MFSKICIKRPVTTVMLTLIVFLAGILSYSNLKLSLMPNMDLPIVLVMDTYVGAGPEEIENLVAKPLEEALGTVSNVDTITSISSANMAIIMVQFVDGTDVDMAALDMREVLDMTKSSLPEDANDPIIYKMDMNAIPIYFGAKSDTMDLTELNTFLDDNVVNRLERIEGVASVSLSGGVENEVRITVDSDKLAGYGVSTSTLSQILAAENMNLPSGSLAQGNTNVQIRTMGEFTSVDEIRDLTFMTNSGALLRVSDVATVELLEADRDGFTYINGEKGILILIDKQSTANLVDVSKSVRSEMDKIMAANPDLELVVLSDTSDYIEDSISNITETAFLSALIAFFVLLAFLKNPITSLIIAVSIPTSMLATFAMMYLMGMSLNMVSMGGVAIGIGMLVDNSVVVLDSIYGYFEKGYSPHEAAEVGTKEVTMSVFASTLTTIAVFLPIAFVKGSIGQLMSNLSYTITFALIASFIVATTFVPMASALLLSRDHQSKVWRSGLFVKIVHMWDLFLDKLNHGYERLLKWSLRHRKTVVLVVVLVFIASLGTIPLTGVNFMDSMDQGQINITIEMPAGSKLEATEDTVLEALYRIQSVEEIETVYANVGGGMMSGGSGSASGLALLVGMDERTRSTDEVCEEIKEMLADIPGADITISASDSAMGSMGGGDVSFNIYGYDNETLMEVEKEVVDLLSAIPQLTDVEGSTGDTVPEARVVIDRMKASRYGITTASIAGALNTAITGSTATTYKVDGTELDVVIRYDSEQINYLTDLQNLTIPSATGANVPLGDIASIVMDESSTSIYRENSKNYVSISANAPTISANEAQTLVNNALASYSFPEGYYHEASGTMEMMNDAFSSLFTCLIVAVLLVYMIMASQFESLKYPFIIMFSMPLAITGGIFGLFITGNTITVTAMLGFVMLIGMVVNNGIVLIDYANQLMDRGMDCYHALVVAGPRRLRPILMTTLTTVLGMVPMALGTQEGSEMMRGMAIGVIFGLTLSTVVTLVFIPVLYYWMDRSKRRRMIKKKARKDKSAAKYEAKLTAKN